MRQRGAAPTPAKGAGPSGGANSPGRRELPGQARGAGVIWWVNEQLRRVLEDRRVTLLVALSRAIGRGQGWGQIPACSIRCGADSSASLRAGEGANQGCP